MKNKIKAILYIVYNVASLFFFSGVCIYCSEKWTINVCLPISFGLLIHSFFLMKKKEKFILDALKLEE
jgi:hypothetical protein